MLQKSKIIKLLKTIRKEIEVAIHKEYVVSYHDEADTCKSLIDNDGFITSEGRSLFKDEYARCRVDGVLAKQAEALAWASVCRAGMDGKREKLIKALAAGVEKLMVAHSEGKPTREEMVDYFDKRTNYHIGLVKKYCKMLGVDDDDHDKSKFESPEYEPYLTLSWNKFKGIEDTDVWENAATLHHIQNNKHHPEYWTESPKGIIASANRDDNPSKPVYATKMPDENIKQMCADWLAMSEELGTDINEWMDEKVNKRWIFTDHQVKLMKECIKKVNDSLEQNDSELGNSDAPLNKADTAKLGDSQEGVDKEKPEDDDNSKPLTIGVTDCESSSSEDLESKKSMHEDIKMLEERDNPPRKAPRKGSSAIGTGPQGESSAVGGTGVNGAT